MQDAAYRMSIEKYLSPRCCIKIFGNFQKKSEDQHPAGIVLNTDWKKKNFWKSFLKHIKP